MVVIKISFNGWDNLRRAVVGISKCRSGPIQPAAVDAMRKTPQMFLTQTHLEQVVHVGCAYLQAPIRMLLTYDTLCISLLYR